MWFTCESTVSAILHINKNDFFLGNIQLQQRNYKYIWEKHFVIETEYFLQYLSNVVT